MPSAAEMIEHPLEVICPLEAGLAGYLVDNECRHGRLKGDQTPVCGCWKEGGAGATSGRAAPPSSAL